MDFDIIPFEILEKKIKDSRSYREVTESLFWSADQQDYRHYLKAKKVIFSGDFPPNEDNSYEKDLPKWDSHVQPEITPETEILICGKYPDWVLVEKARSCGIEIYFTDKEGEFFSRMASKLINRKTASPVEEPMGV